jgi:hypothetical protein
LAILWVPGVITGVVTLVIALISLFDGGFAFAGTKRESMLLLMILMSFVGLIGTIITSNIFKHVKNDQKVPLKKIYQGLAITPFIIVNPILDDLHLLGILPFIPIPSLFVAMLYNRSWAKHQGVGLDAH